VEIAVPGVAIAWGDDADKTPTHLIVPETVSNYGISYTVRAVAKHGFRYCDFEVITLPNTIEKVEELINTAFNEKQEDLIESVRGELKSEYEAVLNELKERIETLESQQGEGNNESESEGGEGESTSTPAIGEGESKADEDEDEEKPRKEDEEDEDEDEDDKKHLEDMIEKAVQKTIQGIFNPKNSPSFHYKKNNKEEQNEEKKGYTPRELAEMLTQTRQ
jgi:hypothetical protein